MSTNKQLNATITIGGRITAGLKSALTGTKSQIKGIGDELKKMTRSQRELGTAIQTFGRMGKDVDGLRSRYSNLTSQIEKLRREQDRLTKAAERHAKLTGLGSKAMVAGAAIGTAGGGMLAMMHGPLDKAKQYQSELARIQALGLDAAAVARAEKYAKDFKAFGNSQLDKIELMRDALAVFGDEHHAEMAMPTLTKMNFANKAIFGSEAGADRTRQLQDMLKVIELRGGTKTAADFEKEANWVQKVISSTGGRVQADEWRKVIATGGLAAKSMKAEQFYKMLEPIVQEKGGDQTGTGLMSSYSSLYQGRSTVRAARNLERFGLIGDKSKVQHDKAGQVSFLNPGALLGSDIFRRSQLEWVEKVLLPQLAKHGITSEDAIIDTIGSIVSNRKGADFLSTLYLQRTQMHKSMAMTDKASGINELTKQAQGTAAGKEQELLAKKNDLLLKLGTQSLPLYVKALELATGALEKLNNFIEKNPKLATAMGNGLMIVGTALAVIGPLLIGGGGMLWGLGQFIAVGSRLMPLLGLLATGVRVLGTALIFLATNPIGLVITAIGVLAGAVYLIYKNWEPIKAWFKGLWGDVTKTFDAAVGYIQGKIDAIGNAWRNAKSFFGFGGESSPTAPFSNQKKTEWQMPYKPTGKPGAAPVQHSTTNHFTINQQPGQDAKSLAKQVALHIERSNRVKNNSTMFDGVATA